MEKEYGLGVGKGVWVIFYHFFYFIHFCNFLLLLLLKGGGQWDVRFLYLKNHFLLTCLMHVESFEVTYPPILKCFKAIGGVIFA
jgi:hypothetical protein